MPKKIGYHDLDSRLRERMEGGQNLLDHKNKKIVEPEGAHGIRVRGDYIEYYDPNSPGNLISDTEQFLVDPGTYTFTAKEIPGYRVKPGTPTEVTVEIKTIEDIKNITFVYEPID